MTKNLKTPAEIQEQIIAKVMTFVHDPLGFIQWAYPWGEKGTILEHEALEQWQIQICTDIKHALNHGWVENNGHRVNCTTGIRIAVASGHGCGKSAFMAMIDDWFMSCCPNPQIVTTANTQTQLNTKTWREKAKWHKLLINRAWFKWHATKYTCNASPETWFSSAIPQSENNAEAFAGTHERFTCIKFDEASGIPDLIWETTEGAFTDSGGIKIWIVFGNPTQANGRFAQCFRRDRDIWITYNINCEHVTRTDKELFKQWEKSYGRDSDFYKVRVLGEFPSQGVNQLIGTGLVDAALGKVIHPASYYDHPKILGVDIALEGDDMTAMIIRQGLASYGLRKFRNMRPRDVAGKIASVIDAEEINQVFLDHMPNGEAIFDFLQGWGYGNLVTPVNFGAGADDKQICFNKRTEMWVRVRDWLENGGAIPNDKELYEDLVGPQVGHTNSMQYQLERKKDMKSRGLSSPDCGDALALTFAYHVAPERAAGVRQRPTEALREYDLFRPLAI